MTDEQVERVFYPAPVGEEMAWREDHWKDPNGFQVDPAVALVVQTRQMIPSGAYLDRDCFVAVLLTMTSAYAVIATEAKQSRRGPAREQASGLHH
jgi:hypothetical protein